MAERASFQLRLVEPRDIEVVAGYEAEIAKVSFPDDPITDLAFYVKKLRNVPGDRKSAGFVAEQDGEVVGWAYVSQRQNFITKARYADFHSIFVSASVRGGGVANALMKAVLDYCAGHDLTRIVFRTRATNERMKAVLARHGFIPTQIYYERNDPDAAGD
ncbi:MAG: GNAT family N-acetyltransferase [Reyranellaceae bacterium]